MMPQLIKKRDQPESAMARANFTQNFRVIGLSPRSGAGLISVNPTHGCTVGYSCPLLRRPVYGIFFRRQVCCSLRGGIICRFWTERRAPSLAFAGNFTFH